MNITKTYNLFKPVEMIFKCPHCASEMKFKNENSLVCGKNHCFDLSKRGYINFSPNQGKMKYSKNLFESRRHIFESGFYDLLINEIKLMINRHEASCANVLDAGCGEGFFISSLFGAEHKGNIFAVDIQKHAVSIAARDNSNIKWIVGDLSNIPIKTGSIELLLNIFSPANYNEFLRVLNDGGLIIKVIPGEKYLTELRECIKDRLINKAYSNERVIKHLCDNMLCVDRKRVFYQMPLTKAHLKSFINMTPMMFNIEIDETEFADINCITLDIEIIAAKKYLETHGG